MSMRASDRLDIFAGISLSVASKIAGVTRRISLDEAVALGRRPWAKNQIVVRDVESELGVTFG